MKCLLEWLAVKFAVFDHDQSGCQQAKSMRQLRAVDALESVGRRDWSDGNSHIERRQHDQGMIDAVCRKDSEWPIRTKPVIEQALGKEQGRFVRFGISNASLAICRLLHEEDPVRGLLRPAIKPVAHAAVVRTERLDR